jgi:prenyltransferase beta subunit
MRPLILACLAFVLCAPLARAADPPKKDKALEESVDKALSFLKSTQRPDGTWTTRAASHPAITALSVMAFLSAGHVPGEGPYGETVEKGIRAVLKFQQPNGLIANDNGHEMYSHGICTLMLAEAAGMTEGPLAEDIRKRLEKAVAIILKAQRKEGVHKGGWRYQVNAYDSDISVTGWQIMALRAAKNLGCDVPPAAIESAIEYVKRCQDPNTGGFRYYPGGNLTVPCTGTSILALEICGKDQHRSAEVLKAASFLLKNPPQWGSTHFSYCVYYCSQATFQLGGQYWNSFREHLHKILLTNQADSGGWFARDGEGQVYGPNYCTAMGVLALTVEYRFLPIYQRGEEQNEKEK